MQKVKKGRKHAGNWRNAFMKFMKGEEKGTISHMRLNR